MKRSLFVAIAATMTSLVSLSAARAQTIGINFQGNDSTPLASTDSVGVVPSINWNNLLPNSGTVVTPNLVDSTNTGTSLNLSYTSQYNVEGVPSTSTPFENLYDSHLESPYVVNDSDTFAQAISATNRVTVSLTNIPYATYDLYVYVGGNAGNIYEASSADTVINTATMLGYTNANPGGEVYIAGDNYVEFTGLTSSSLYLYVGFPSSQDDAGLNSGISGIQIVNNTSSVPEPSTYALILAGLGVLVMISRKQQRT